MSELTGDQRNELQQQLLAMRLALEERVQAAETDREPVSLDCRSAG